MSRTPLILCAAGLAACAGGISPEQQIGETGAGLTAGETFCQIVNALPAKKVGDVDIKNIYCNYTDYDDNLFYLGSDYGTAFSSTNRTAEAGADSILCALRDADRSQPARAFVDGGTFGTFGFDSIVEIGHFDPQARTIDGQRLGRLWLFGVPLAFDVQDFAARFPVETKVSGSRFFQTRTSGYYADLTSSRTNWGISGSATVDFPPPIEFSLSLDHKGQYRSYQNDALSWRQHSYPWYGNDGNFAPNPDLSYDTWTQTCVCSGWICNCPTAADQQAHANVFDYTNLTDTLLPWTGTTHGVVGPYAYLAPQRNWWHFGYPHGGHVLNEPDELGTDVTHLSLSAGLRYDIVLLKLQLDAGFSSGLALYQTDTNIDHPQVVTGTQLDNRVTASVTAHLVVDNPFPFGPDPLIDADFTVLNPPPAIASTNPSYEQFANNGTGLPNPGLDRCMSTPPMVNPVTPPTDPATGLNDVIKAAQAHLLPCDILLCKPSSLTSSTGTLQSCVWDAAAKKVACTETGRACNVCTDSSVQLCDANGNRMPRTNITQHGCGTPR